MMGEKRTEVIMHLLPAMITSFSGAAMILAGVLGQIAVLQIFGACVLTFASYVAYKSGWDSCEAYFVKRLKEEGIMEANESARGGLWK